MPKCKKSDCREEAVPVGKRYCPRHLAEYRAKQRAYEVIQRTLPDCISCGVKLSKSRADAGEKVCGSCAQRIAEQRAAHAAEQERYDALDACQTVEDLKQFILTYLLVSPR